MAANQMIIGAINGTMGILKMHLADMTDADLMVRPVPAANHAAWQLTHMAALDVAVAETVAPGQTVTKPETFTTASEKGASKCDDPAKFPKKDEIMSVVEAANAITIKAVEGMTEADFAKPSPEGFRGFAPTIGDLLILGPMHANMHLGQLQVIRRALGKPHVF